MRPLIRWAAAVAVLSVTVTGPALAQADWPARAVRIIVPAPAGGPYDRTIRPLAQQLSLSLRQPVVVDNRPSAGNIVGTQAGATAAPDGYTLTMTGMLNTIAQSMYDNVPFDIVKDFEHVGSIGEGAQWLVVRPDANVSSFQDLVEQAKREPGKINYASSGAGSSGHLVMELLQRAAGIQFTHVPYKGGAPALQDVLAGVVPLTILPISAALSSVQAGKLKVLAVTSGQRSPLVPNVPTFAELGYKQLAVNSWVGLSAPKGTPAPVVQKLNAALQSAMKDPALLKQLDAEGLIPLVSTPEQYTQLVRSDTERWGQLVRSLNIKAN
ncbi:tripartite tricarboxylate transporter substrate binding protein [Variovorax sp. J22G21]|uniref:Bug family tripartite tricarboxylate transporter substrate binding protein n=1 Tax=Variovorax fucosicus TaxID=3053517 RepID=UPI0025751A74|nr:MULTISPECIES: tripartite tricarboxylate transporter substrate binding protein [unclassified Variovorax]MDM0041234.1 tripartite tricarboxylate transporter substrate binding protein [Variovorax sp. J22R193]MDM0060291.1 tripartite tricarboxylate transporter substrate binding protein [Variovorax sp. J22G21]